MNFAKAVCCCGGDDDDGAPYERFYDDSTVTSVRREDARLNNRGIDELDNTTRESSHKQIKSKEQQEEEALNRILENTQHNIIDVSHLDGMTLNTSEYIARAQQYEEAIRVHDQNILRGVNGPPRSPNCANKAAEWLGRPGTSREAYADVRRLIAEVYDAIDQGVHVDHKTDLVVYMDM
ncbi:hypothetical protein ANCCEY_12071 [Ancylostoma ceylanicum]|uniref:Ragulator complex protein LAMTOR1 n=1 Tax=Ancylostoma ceylanicum TaxID=53326 RepID=A0A0D6LA44_9BILA|nr:hypothetical protein ANCCEY_12071 [Ancylostoma ceylanicum]